ncbi:hypothetical protein QM797_19480 [Rhodococcus sp. IEGM 1381]|uniref:hypothetical protein n=1 Tax=Rhodococcus sp. IEGM 1381 TaxID=3047085 RepID=UPI0024B7449B|nr:hypothetical protein [Rhodococcus sp. IEGM 1381]MDI9896907.1 hypothetical protein [Rhodococcus sp. IEGM 1381]
MTIDRVPVSGGDVVVETHTGTSEPVLVVHGVSSQRMLWSWLRGVAALDPRRTGSTRQG